MMKKILFLAALLLLLTTASGCRSRTSAAPRASGTQPPAASSDSGTAADGEPEAPTENGGETVENPLAERAEYDEAARAELLENQSRAVSGEGEGGGLLHNNCPNHQDQKSLVTQMMPERVYYYSPICRDQKN